MNAGGRAVYTTKKKIEAAVLATKKKGKQVGRAFRRGSDRLVQKTLKKPANYMVSPNDRVRTVAKWVAVGGSASTSFFAPLVGAAIGAVNGLFILYDP